MKTSNDKYDTAEHKMDIKKLLNKTHEWYYIGFDDKKKFTYIEEFHDLKSAQEALENIFSSEKLYIVKRAVTFSIV